MPEVSNEEKIKILLQEYATLRQEIIARTTHGFQLISVGTVVLTWLVATRDPGPFLLIVVLTAAAVLLAAVWLTFRAIGRAATRVRQLEAEVNRRAGEDLLVWETGIRDITAHFWQRAHWRPNKPLVAQSREEEG